jgi:two-component system, cell cycle sensor histidine kinase and response regulator CckA
MSIFFAPRPATQRAKHQRRGRLVAAAVILLIVALFILELQVPVGVALWLPRRWQTYLTTAICSVLTLAGVLFAPAIVPTWVAIVNRSLGILAFWVTAFVGLAARRTGELQEMNRRLRLEIAERQRGEERLAEQASLLDLAQDAILVRTMDDRIIFWNRGAERLYGWSAREALGKDAIKLLLQAESPDIEKAYRELLKKGQWLGSMRHATRDGQSIIVESRWTLVRDPLGVPKSVLVVNTDMTEKLKLEAQLLRKQRLESVGVLAGGVAHDFNNLLTPILVATKLLREGQIGAERDNLLSVLQASAERGAEMIRRLLAFAGGNSHASAPLQIGDVVDEIKSILQHTFPKGIRLTTDVADDLAPVLADATQLSQVLMNLCVNARDAMPNGGALTITAENLLLTEEFTRRCAGAQCGPHVRIAVADSGTGMPPEVIDRIFDPFFTTKDHGKGSGLGLSSVLGIVTSHGGFVDVQSEVGQGSRFSVYLPVVPSSTATPVERPRISLPGGQGERILVVDDEVLILEAVSAILESKGYHVLPAADGADAVAIFAKQPRQIECVLVDMMMPGMDGSATVAALRKLRPDVRVIATSGLRPTGNLAAEIAAGELAFLQKPYSDEQLLTLVHRTVQGVQ